MAAERPLLILPEPALPLDRDKGRGGGARPKGFDTPEQRERADIKMDVLRASLEGSVPEFVLVLEIAESVMDFIDAVRNIEGLDFLNEIEKDDFDSEAFPKTHRGRLFMLFSNHRGAENLLSLWERHKEGERLDRGLGKWKEVFGRLHDIRKWGVKDRLLDTGIMDTWKEDARLEQDGLYCEMELWFRTDSSKRARDETRVIEELIACNGEILDKCIIPQIRYHAILAKLPAATLESISEDEETWENVSLIQCEHIQYFRATGQIVAPRHDQPDESYDSETKSKLVPEISSNPLVALFDGVPIENHEKLKEWMIVDDQDHMHPGEKLVQKCKHGTAMASLIIHGDLHDESTKPISQKIYVRPIMKVINGKERVPKDVLVVDLLHRAVKEIFEGGSASSIRVINLSIGIIDKPFVAAMSPLARLIDWLAWEYEVLFLVSAGNFTEALPVPYDARQTLPSFTDPQTLRDSALGAMFDGMRFRRLLSPAESINAVTVGATNSDQDSREPREFHLDLLPKGYPSLLNRVGLGYRRAIKPDILMAGGRFLFSRPLLDQAKELEPAPHPAAPPAQKIASPGDQEGSLRGFSCSRGTSNSTALASHSVAMLYPALAELKMDPGGELIDTIPEALWLKTLLVHSARWPNKEICKIYEKHAQRMEVGGKKEHLSRFFGNGMVDTIPDECFPHRVTALAGGKLRAEEAHEHRFPLPRSLKGREEWQELAVTLSWFTPVNPRHQHWKKAHLWFEIRRLSIKARRGFAFGHGRRAVKRGTLQHEVFSGEKIASFVDGDEIVIKVNCRPDAGLFEDAIPYALAVTLQVGERSDIDVYAEVRDRIRQPLPLPP